MSNNENLEMAERTPSDDMPSKKPVGQGLDEATRAKYFSSHSRTAWGYDPSVFVEALQDEQGNLQLYVPARKRMAWFKTDYPDGVVTLDPPEFKGRMVTVTARVYKTRDDYRTNVPAAVNMATRVINDKEEFLVDVCATRAQSRALRDLGYDIPRDAHIIEGWTPIKAVATGSKLPEDALEASVIMERFMSDLTPAVNVAKKGAAVPEQTAPEQTAPEQTAPEQTAPEQAAPKASAESAAKPQKASRKRTEASPQETPAKSEAEGKKAKAQDDVVSETKAAAGPEDNSVPTGVAEKTAETQSDTDAAAQPDASGDELLQRAMSVFASVDEAGAYHSRLLQKGTVAEQEDVRIRYFANKALRNTCRDEKLGLAAYMVALHRGITL